MRGKTFWGGLEAGSSGARIGGRLPTLSAENSQTARAILKKPEHFCCCGCKPASGNVVNAIPLYSAYKELSLEIGWDSEKLLDDATSRLYDHLESARDQALAVKWHRVRVGLHSRVIHLLLGFIAHLT